MCLGIPGRIDAIVDMDVPSRMAEINFGGVRKTISLAFVPDARDGDYVIVHAGFAISVIDEREAMETLNYLKNMEDR